MSEKTKTNFDVEGVQEEIIKKTIYATSSVSSVRRHLDKKKSKRSVRSVGKERDLSKQSSSISRTRTQQACNSESVLECEWEELEEEKNKFKRLHMYPKPVQEYFEFKAARAIQTCLRGWYTRRNQAKRKHAAEIIQRAWRGFLPRRIYYRKLEQTLQDRIVEHYNRQATKIQALWRGYWSRQHIHDHNRLTRLQERSAKDLLHCIAFKLHHLLRTHQIPGVYSLRNSKCFSKVEKLLASMSFKHHNELVRVARTRKDNAIYAAKKEYGEALYNTEIPYAGPDFRFCEPKCCELYREKDADKKMFRILSLYERETETDPRIKKINKEPKSPKKQAQIAKGHGKRHRKEKPSDFCGDIVKSMKRWKILGENKLTIKSDVFEKPENVEKFLQEIQSIHSFLQAKDCYCHLKPQGVEKCHA